MASNVGRKISLMLASLLSAARGLAPIRVQLPNVFQRTLLQLDVFVHVRFPHCNSATQPSHDFNFNLRIKLLVNTISINPEPMPDQELNITYDSKRTTPVELGLPFRIVLLLGIIAIAATIVITICYQPAAE